MVVRCPQILLLRMELMKNSLYFFKSEMKRPISELLDYPEYFTYSLESRIKPRYMRVATKGIRCSLDWFLNCSDQRFEERMRGDFIEGDAPGLSLLMDWIGMDKMDWILIWLALDWGEWVDAVNGLVWVGCTDQSI